MSRNDDLPDLGEVLGALFQRVSPEKQPLLLALLERLAAERYRGWAEQVSDPKQREGLLACAGREEEIARRAEACDPDAQATQAAILEANPDLSELNRSLFAPFSLEQQWTLQARGERLGGQTWLAFAGQAPSPGAKEAFRSCAPLEEENARFLESLVGSKS